MPSISYAITVCNELEEIKSLLEHVSQYITEEDEILLQIDSTNSTQELKNYIDNFNMEMTFKGISFHRIYCSLNGDFASFKNNLKEHCSKDYILFIDADELLTIPFISNIKLIIEQNLVDVIVIPRINTVDGLTEEHINKWRWNINKDNYINYPDYQMRICKNIPNIKWINKVHERLDGFKTIGHIPSDSYDYCIIHHKNIKKQEQQNNFYSGL